jgi:hypothetical protein
MGRRPEQVKWDEWAEEMRRLSRAASDGGRVRRLARQRGVTRFLVGLALVAGVVGFVSGSRVQAASTATTYRDEVLTDSPRAYWRLGETGGSTATDELGALPGTYTNGVLLNQPGALASETNPAASFDGVNDYMVVPTSSSLDLTSAVTVEFWAKRRAISSTFQVLVGKPGNGQSRFENYAVWLNTANNYQAYFGDGTTYVQVTTSAVTDTNWHHIVATDNGATAKIYLDGVLKESKSTTLRLTANTNPLNFGRANNNTTFFNGWLDEVAIYPTALSATRIQAHYIKGTTDQVAPVVTLTQPAGDAALASSSVTFSGRAGSASGDSGTVTVKVYSGTTATGTPAQTLTAARQGDNSYAASATLADGTWTAQAEQRDSAGNTGTSSANTFTVTTVPPVTTISSGPPNASNVRTATFSFSADKPVSFQCSLDGSAFAACSSPKTYSGLADGSHTFRVKATDPAGNTSTASYTWTVDTLPPPAPTITSNPPSQTSSTSANFGFSDAEAGVTALCRVDSGVFSSCSSPQTYSDLVAGVHTFDVKVQDAAGNESSTASYTWTIGPPALPPPTFDTTPPDPTSQTSATFGFSDAQADVSFECSLDGASYDACTSPASLSGLVDGSHTFGVRARDSDGNLSAAQTYTWTVDTAAPGETITSEPPNPSNSTTASFSFTANETASFECSLDGAPFASCSSPQSYSGLAAGSHTFLVTATDQAGNSSTASYTWTVDTTAPSTTITSKPSNPSNSTTPSFVFSANETASFECSLDGAAFVSCSSPKGYSGLADGTHTFRVRATDQAGNTGQAASYGWMIDTVPPPAPTITSNPSSLTTSTSASFGFSDTETGVTLLCQLDGAGFSSCTSPRSYSGLADGSHTFDVKARDTAGNESAYATYLWTVDTTAPITTLVSNPSNPSSQATATFVFVANEPASFGCSLDGTAFAACSSPKSYSGLAGGSHTFQVRATDQVGNVGPIGSYTWTVDTIPPTITLTSPTNGDTRAEWPTFKGGAGVAAGDSPTVTVKLYSGATPTGSPLQTLTATAGFGPYAVIAASPLNPGTYTAQAQQTDTAGNVGSSSANTFTVGDPVVLTAGDIAYCPTDGASRTAPLLSREPDALVMTLGDNAYVNGQPEEYRDCYDPTWGVAKARTRPVVGPHDEGVVPGGPPAGTGYLNYFADQLAPFAPTANDPSKLYYSYDLGSWHVVVLNDSCIEGYTPNCNEIAQEQWLANDLAAHTNQCTVVAHHEPRWSSDSIHGNRPQIGAFWNIFYRYGVDLVLNGSAHDYERFAPQDAGGRLDTSYGIREIVVGTGGDFTYALGTLQPNSEVYSSSSYGVLKLSLHSTSYEWEFLPVADGLEPAGGSFTDSGSSSCHGAPPANLTAPSVRAASSNAANAATSLPFSKPAGTAQGDLLLAIVSHQGGNQRNITPPSGWTIVPNTDYRDSNNVRIHGYYRIAGASEPASYIFTLTGGSGQDMAGGILDLTGAGTSAPINASGGQSNGGPNSKAVPAPSITTTVANTLLVYAGSANVASTFTPPGQMIESWDLATSGAFRVCTESATLAVASAGPTGTQTAFLSTSGRSVAIAIAIAPAP